MKFLSLYKNSQVFKLALGIAIAVVLYIATVFFDKMQKLDQSVELIATSSQTQLQLEKLLSIVSNYETSLRSFIITKDDNYLRQRFLNRGEIALNIRKLKQLTSANPIIKKDLDSLSALFDYRYNLFHETLTIAKSPNYNKNELNAKLLEGSDFTDKIRKFVYKRINTEGEKLRQLNDNHQFELEDSVVSAFLLVILSLLILLLSFNKMKVDISELKRANDELAFLNHSFNNAEKIAGFGHWSINLKTDVYTFSDNFYRLIGLEPQSFKPCYENLFNRAHPDDLKKVQLAHENSLNDLQPVSVLCRYLLDNGDIRYIMSVSSFTRNSVGDLVKVGVNYDLTDQYRKTAELEDSNKELKATNAELESFNNIASHDLQEPLRKIQMFISRIDEIESHGLSEKGKEYFSRIHLAANRMQNLIIDLVNYRRTMKGEKIFTAIDLKVLIEKIKFDLAQNIEEKSAIITIGSLPLVNGISFQLEQLFVNLTINALKYSRENVQPQISVASETFADGENHDGLKLSGANYHKIVFQDNGIGFKQEFADKIFLLFHRLETDSKYSGTGLGLAICKKIVENHNGIIKVSSSPGEGTDFLIYLPITLP